MTATTVREVLFGSQGDPAEVLARRLHAAGVVSSLVGTLARLSAGGQMAVARRIAAAVARLADVDLVDVAAAGWRKHRMLTEAARRTLEEPGSERLVDLASHRITSEHRASFEVFLDSGGGELHLGTLDLALHLELVVHGLVATVSDGRLVALEAGACTLGARLSCEGVELASGQDKLDAVLLLDLDEGLPLLARRHPRPAPTGRGGAAAARPVRPV